MTSTWIIQATVALRNNQVKDGCILKDGTLQTYGDISYLNQLPKVNELFRQLGLTIRVVTEAPSDVLDYTYRFSYIGVNGHIDIVGGSNNLSSPITDCTNSCDLIDDADLISTIDELYPLTPIEKVLLLAGMQHLVPSCEFMFYPNDPSRDESNRQDLYIPSVGWTDVYSTLTGTMANTGAVTGGIFDFTDPSSVVETYQITWINGGVLVTSFAIGFNRVLTDAERAALGQVSFWSQLFAGTAIVIGNCTAGTDYYVDATSGLDGNTGLLQATPWKTLTKVNTSSFTPGDRIHLKRGEVWREAFTVPSPSIAIDAYGVGPKPEINGALLLKGTWSPSWELLGNGSMEGWTNSTTPNGWSKELTGASTITQESSVVENGNFSLKMSVDSSNSYIGFNQFSAAGVASTSYTFSIWFKIPVGKSALFQIRSQASGNYLHSNGSWGASDYITLTGTGSWAQYTITFTSENPTTTFRVYVYRLTSASSDLYFDQISLQPTTPPAADNIWTYYTYLDITKLFFNGVLGTKVAAVGDLSEAGEYYSTGGTIQVYSTTEPSVTWTAPGIEKPQNFNSAVVNTSNVVFDGIRITKAYFYNIYGGNGVGEEPFGVIIKNCTIDYAEATGIQMGATGLGHVDGWRVRGNTINYNGGTLDASTDHGIYISHSSDNIIEDNTFIGNQQGWAVQIQDASNNNIVRRNMMTGNGGAVVIYDNGDGMPTGNLIYSNLSVGDGPSSVFNVAGPGSAAVTNSFYHNTVVNALGIGFNAGVDAGSILKNNIIWNSTGANLNVNVGVTDVISDYNIFGPEGAGFISYNGSGYATLAAYKTASGFDVHSIKDNPLFVGGSDYSLQAGSPAINAGIAIPGITEDILRHPFVGAPDIGAYERQ